FSGLSNPIGIPNIFVISLNDSDLLLGLWHGNQSVRCYAPDQKSSWDWQVLVGKLWEGHGASVAMASAYIPSSFDHPRNPAKKVNTQYKAWEYLIWIFGMGPALLHSILPFHCWQSYCKLVCGCHLANQHTIHTDEIVEIDTILFKFTTEFKALY